jgi:hypothetical protein
MLKKRNYFNETMLLHFRYILRIIFTQNMTIVLLSFYGVSTYFGSNSKT